MGSLNSSTVVSLAILKTNYENNRDFLEIFVPIVAEAIRISDDEIVTASNIQKAVESLFGLRIPQNTLKTLLMRVKKRNYIRQENHFYYKNRGKLTELEQTFRHVQQNVVRMYEELVREFLSFCRETYDLELQELDADNAFQIYLRENEKTADKQTVIPTRSLDNLSKKSVVYFVGMFIQHLEQSHSSYFDSWVTILTGNMLANSVFLVDPTQPNRRFKNTSIYFDTSFLINALGYAGEPRQAPCLELLDLLYEVGANLKCFQHTIEEMRGILSACEARIAKGQVKYAYGEVFEYFILKGFSSTDITLFLMRLETNLHGLRIKIEDKPDYKTHSLVIDEAALKEILNSALFYREPDGLAIYRDVASISAIIRLRKDYVSPFLEDSKALFITGNTELARVSREFFYSSNEQKYTIPVCMTDYELTTKVWLKKAHNAPDLPRKRIIADYYAAIQPDDNLLKQYYEEIEKLNDLKVITPEDYYLLRYSLDSKAGLMEITQGGEDPITDVTIAEALTYIKDKLLAEEQGKTQEIIREREAAKNMTATLQAAEIEQRSKIKFRSEQVANHFIKWLRRLVILSLTITTISTFPWDMPLVQNEPIKYSLFFLQVVLLVISIVNLMFGTPIETFIRRTEVRLAYSIERNLLKILN